MADTGAPGRKRDGAPAALPVSGRPCCGLPSPLASAIRSTVRTPSDGIASAASLPPPSGEDGEDGEDSEDSEGGHDPIR
ncbi:hypothetical protein [Lysobacter antibioticus]|uniref:hypothetical protein n=1 Tax=Lysobacter antibioticus TaxID=84531 RepID=UPI000A49E327|nr:hypothetical protein [Lysobacter antibioticus]